ncbi:MAG: NAD(P)/FAD-dependent oxidoreductase [Micromonosporaceae bacterium]
MTHVVIVGAGIIGATLAEALTRRGANVTIIDRDRAGQGATASSLAWINANNRQPRSYHDFAVLALREWQHLAERYAMPSWYHSTGNLTWAESEVDRERLAQRVARLEQVEYRVERLTQSQAAALEPNLVIPLGADIVFFPDEGYVEGAEAVATLLASASASGCRVIENDPVCSFEQSGDRIRSVRLASGHSVRGDVYVAAAGWRTPALLQPIAVSVPLLAVDGRDARPPCLVATVPVEPGLVGRLVQSPLIKMRPKGVAEIQLEASDINDQTSRETPDEDLARLAADLLARARRLVPTLAGAEIGVRDVCVRPMPSDGLPIVGPAPGTSNVYLMVTHSGITLGSLLARLVASELIEERPAPLLEPYRPRNSAGSQCPDAGH